jgi:hypothetical protein
MRERRLLSELWSMSAATFRRLGKIEQARGAIQEAEVRDETNPAVWVQVRMNPHPRTIFQAVVVMLMFHSLDFTTWLSTTS